MDPVRISVVFDAQGQPQLQRAAQSLTQLSTQLSALTASSATAGRALRVMEADLNRFAYTLNRTVASGIHTFNLAFEKMFGLFNQVSRISFYGALGQVAALTYALKGLGRQFFEINEQFSGLEITLKSMFGSMQAARRVREELARITITSPLQFKDLADATRSVAAMPSLAPKFASQIGQNNLSDPNGFFRKYIGLLEKMTTFRPDKTTSDAVFALREAIGGELRSLVRRFEFPASLLVQASGKPLDYLKTRPEEMLKAMTAAFNRMISDKATLEISRQPSKLIGNIIEQALQIPLLQIARAGEKEGKTSFYQHLLDKGVAMLARFGEFADVDKGPFGARAKGIGDALTRVFDTSMKQLGNLLEKGLGMVGAGQKDIPGASPIERVYAAIQRFIEFIADNLPAAAAAIENFVKKFTPLANLFVSIWKNIFSALGWAFDKGPWTALAGVVALKSLPSLVSRSLSMMAESFINAATSVRAGVASVLGMGPLAATLAASKANLGASGAAYGFAGGGVGTYQAGIGRNPFLYNEDILRQAGIGRNARGQLYHLTEKTGAVGYFGQTYNAAAGAFADPLHLPSSLMMADRYEAQLARQGVAFDPATNSYRWLPGSAGPAGAVAQPGRDFTRLNMGRENRGLPPGITYDARINRYRGYGGGFVPEAWVRANMPAAVPYTSGEMYSAVRGNLRSGGAGRIVSALGGGAAGAATFFGASEGVAAGFGTALGGTAASISAVVTPILVAAAASAVIYTIYDKIAAYAEEKRTEYGAMQARNLGITDADNEARFRQIEKESAYGRAMSGFIRQVQNDPSLSGYTGATRPYFDSQAVRRLSKVVLGREVSLREGGLTGETVPTSSVTAMPLTREVQMDFPALVAYHNQLYQDLSALGKVTSSRKMDGPLRLQTAEIMRNGKLVDSKNQPNMVENLGEAHLIATTLTAEFTRVSALAEEMRKVHAVGLKTPGGTDLFKFVTPPTSEQQEKIDAWKRDLEQFTSSSAFSDASRHFDTLREVFKANELNPGLRQLIDSQDNLLTAAQDAENEFRHIEETFAQDTSRIVNLRDALSAVDAMIGNRGDIGLGPSGASMEAILSESKTSLEEIQSKFIKEFGTEGLKNIIVNYKFKDAAGNDRSVPMAMDEYLKELQQDVTKVTKEALDNMRLALRGNILKNPAEMMTSAGLKLPAALEKLVSASDSETTGAALQAINFLSDLQQNTLLTVPDSSDAISEGVAVLMRQLQSIPSENSAVTDQEKETIRLRRMQLFHAFFSTFDQMIADFAKKFAGTPLAADLDTALAASGIGRSQFSRMLRKEQDVIRGKSAASDFSRQEQAFFELMSGGVLGNTDIGRGQMQDAVAYAQRRYGITLGANDLSWTRLPTDAERTTFGLPGERTRGALGMMQSSIIPQLEDELRIYSTQALAGDPVAEAAVVRLKEDLAKFKKELSDGTTKVIENTNTAIGNNLSTVVNLLQSMTDPELGHKLTRRGSAVPGIIWQSGRGSAADDRVALLQAEFDRMNSTGLGKGRQLTRLSSFDEALKIDTRGFNASTGELKRLTAFQEQFMTNATEMTEWAKDPTTTDELRKKFESAAASMQKLADQAERTKESITGRGGVFGSMVEGFGEVVSSWEASASNWTAVGAGIANSLSSNLTDALVNITVHAKDAGEAFKQFGFNVAETAARLAMNKVVEQLLGAIIGGIAGGGLFSSRAVTSVSSANGLTGSGGTFGVYAAGGGLIPGPSSDRDNTIAHVASGEFVIPAKAVRRFGAAHFEAYRSGNMPGYASGGLVGSLPVNSHAPLAVGMPVNAPVSVTVNIDQSGNARAEQTDPQTSETKSRLLAESLSVAVREQLMREQRQGGVLYNMVRANRK